MKGKLTLSDTAKSLGEQLTSEEINTFLKVNNGDQPMNKQGPNAWVVGNNVIAMYKQEGGAWHLSIIVHKQKIKRNRET